MFVGLEFDDFALVALSVDFGFERLFGLVGFGQFDCVRLRHALALLVIAVHLHSWNSSDSDFQISRLNCPRLCYQLFRPLLQIIRHY